MNTHGTTPSDTIINRLKKRSSYLKAAEVMALLGMTRATLCALINSGALPAIRLGKNNMVDPVRLAAYLEARSTG
jgi:hypothetical protein